MADYILNEWVWADLFDNSNIARRDQTFEIFVTLKKNADRLISVKPSSFERKAWTLCKAAQRPQREFAKFIAANVLFDSERCLFIPADNLDPLPGNLHAVNIDDQYLVKALLKVPESTLITIDNPLLEILRDSGHAAMHRDDFAPGYLSR